MTQPSPLTPPRTPVGPPPGVARRGPPDLPRDLRPPSLEEMLLSGGDPPVWLVRLLSIAVAILLVAGGAALATADEGFVAEALGTADQGPPHPDEWDPRVAEIAAFVEQSRGRDFDHPVFVDFLTDEAYSEQTRVADDELDSESEVYFAQIAGVFRAIGIAEGPLDLFAANNETSDGGTLAFYSPTDTKIRVRGTELTPGLKVTIAHELTHALQGQHFDLDNLTDGREGQRVAFRALVEGDATRVENDYVENGLSDSEREAYFAEIDQIIAQAEADLASVPPASVAFFNAPYSLGTPLIDILFAIDGNDAVDAALEDPPPSEEALLDPVTFLIPETAGPSGEGGPIELDVPEGATLVDSGEFGVVSWFLVLAERIDPAVALRAADGWANDGYVAYETDGVVCVDARFVGDEAIDVDEMTAALDEWAATLPAGIATVTTADDAAIFHSCDPGENVPTGTTGRIRDVLVLPAVRSVFTGDLVEAYRLDLVDARCAAAALVAVVGIDRFLSDDETYFSSDTFLADVQTSVTGCV